QYSCGHVYQIVAHWCRDYIDTQKRCPPDVRYFENMEHDCGECRPKHPTPWEFMIERNKKSLPRYL
ncbi:hypothetical protein QBC35DRAFT_396214, partial [Podospora australis]